MVYGNSAGLPANLAAMTPEQGFRIDGQLPGDYAGVAVAALGDVNGDGTPDFAVGAPGTDGTLPAVKGGKVYVIFGSKCSTATAPDGSCQSATTNANLDLGNLGTRGYVINGPALPAVQQNPLSPPAHFGAVIATHRSGSSSTSADVNNDGRDDIVIGSPDEAPSNLADAGSAYVVYGKADSSAQSIDGGGYGGYRIDGSSAGAALGSSVSIVGDTGGEEHADVAVGAPGDNSANPATAATRTNAGTVYIVRGAAMPSAVSSGALLGATQSTGYAIYGASGDAIGRSVADIGDANGDGLADIGIGGVGHSYVLYGHQPTDNQGPSDAQDLSDPNATDGYAITPPTSSAGQQATIAGVGDLNDDAQPDIALSYPASSTNGRTANGTVYTVLSQAGLDPPAGVDLNQLGGQQGATIYGEQGSQTGTSLAAVDAASDGDPGLIVGAPASGPGTAWIVPSIALNGVPDDAGSGGTMRALARAQAAARPRRQKRRSCRAGKNAMPIRVVCSRLTSLGNTDTSRRPMTHGFNDGTRRFGDGYPINRHTELNARAPIYPRLRLNVRGDGAIPMNDTNGKTPLAWPIKDSLDHVIAYIAQLKANNGNPDPNGFNHSHAYFLWTAQKNFIGATDFHKQATLELEGVGCEKSAALMRRDVLMVIKKVGTPFDLRGFMPRAAFPAGAWRKKHYGRYLGDPDYNKRFADTFYAPCTRNNFRRLKPSPPAPQSKPAFNANTDKYRQSSYDNPRDKNNYHQFGGLAPYTNYTKGDGGQRIPDLTILASETTNVSGGGLTRAVILNTQDAQGNPPGPISEGDKINYSDRNVPCGSPFIAHWYFVNANPDGPSSIWTWMPKVDPQGTAQATPGLPFC